MRTCGPPPWPAFRDEWVLCRDDDLLVVHKPPGVPSQRYDADVPDDLPSRLTAYLSAAGGEPPKLGVHQRLDQDTSGVILYTLSDLAKSAVGKAFESREVSKEYLALVVSRRPPEGPMEDMLRRGRGAKMEVVSSAVRGAKLARSHVRVVEQRGDHHLLAVSIETGRTHQIRAQLAHRHCPVAGDTLYGGAPAPRLMLHAHRLGLTHPRTGEALSFEAQAPASFARLMAGERGLPSGDGWIEALTGAAERRYALGLARLAPEATSAFRWVHGRADGLPGLKIDIFGDYVVLNLYDEEAEASVGELLDLLRDAGWASAYVKRRPKKASGLSPAQRLALAPHEPGFGVPAPQPLPVFEHGVRFDVELGGSFGVGLFLDQRQNRARVRQAASGRRMLNLFAHTCSFSVAAALGGAASTLSVDASRSALERGRANLAATGLAVDGHRFIKEDAFVFLGRLARRSERFDLVVVDPPTYSTTRAKRWKSGEGWVELSRACFEICAPGASVLATTNDTRLSSDRLRRHLHEGARSAGRTIAHMRSLPRGRDFPLSDQGEGSSQSLWIELGD